MELGIFKSYRDKYLNPNEPYPKISKATNVQLNFLNDLNPLTVAQNSAPPPLGQVHQKHLRFCMPSYTFTQINQPTLVAN